MIYWISVAFLVGVLVGGVAQAAQAAEYKRRWKEALKLIEQLDERPSVGVGKIAQMSPAVRRAVLARAKSRYRSPEAAARRIVVSHDEALRRLADR